MPSRALLPAAITASLAGAVLAQAPSVEYRLIASAYSPDIPFSLPQGATIRNFVPAGPGQYLISTADSRLFLSDGDTLTEVCRAGTQIPGQPEGTLWRGLMNAGNTIALDHGGVAFAASITLPGGSVANRTVAGNPRSGPIGIADSSLLTAATRTSLLAVTSANGQLDVGAIGSPATTIVPPNFTPPGLAGTIRSWSTKPRLNPAGSAAGNGSTSANESFGAVIDADGFHTALATGKVIHTDRGDFTLRNAFDTRSAPMDDGSVVWTVSVQPASTITVIADRDGNGPTLPLTGDHAPGCAPDDLIASITVYAATGNGLIAWGASLTHDGAPAGAAIFLRKNGRDRLILRSGSPVAGAPDGAPVGLFDPTERGFSFLTVDVNRHGDVAILVFAGPAAGYLYNPEAGTVEFARANSNLSIPPLSGRLSPLTPAFGSFSGSFTTNGYSSGGDDDRCMILSDTGAFAFAGGIGSPFSTTFAASARINSPGCRPDYTADGFLDFFDYIAFVDCFEGAGPCPNGKDADFNNDDFADFFDYADFVDAFEHGC